MKVNKIFKIFLLLLLLSAQTIVLTAKDLIIVKNKKALCRLVVPKLEDRWLKSAVSDLADYIFKSTGARPKIVSGKVPDDSLINIHVGSTDYVKNLKLDMPSPQGFVIQFPDDKNIVIAGRPVEGTELNTMYGAHRFLEKYLGVRWLFPLELGEYVPKHDTLAVPVKNIAETPSFLRRDCSGADKAYKKVKPRYSGMIWAMRMGYMSKAGLRFNHNVGNILPPEIYTKTHPEFFPLINGKRYLPKPNPKNKNWRLHYWDACYTAPGIVDEAAKNIIKYFDENPGIMSYSLSVNDNANICQCANCRAKNKDMLHGSDSQSYYEWVNAVVKKVREKYPDKYFGLLSYPPVVDPPKNIRLDDHIVPVICRDLGYWADPETRKNVDEKRIKAWSKVAPTIGLWDYLNSDAYIFPRITLRHNAGTLKYLYSKGLKFYHGELHPGDSWKNGPQPYMRFKLLWNINLDPEKLIKEWCTACVGEKAAPYLEQYYDYLERFWTERAIKTAWFKQKADTRPYLERKTLGYLDALKQEDLDKCEELLAKTCELAETQKQKQRAKFIQDYFLSAKEKYLEPYINFVKMSGKKAKAGRVIMKFDCDKALKEWKPWKKAHAVGKFYIDKHTGFSRSGAFAVDSRNSLPSAYVFRKNIDIAQGKTYRVTAMVKTGNMAKDDLSSLRIRFLKEKGVFGGDMNNKRIYQYEDVIEGGTKGQWKKLQVCFKVPENVWKEVKAMSVWIIIGVSKTNSKAWVDDITVEEIRGKPLN